MLAAALKRFSDELFQLNWISIRAATAAQSALMAWGGRERSFSLLVHALPRGSRGKKKKSNLSINLI